MLSGVTGVLLAGGQSRRMGEDKRFLQVGNATLLDRSLNILKVTFQDVCIVIAQDSPALQASVPVFRDLRPDCGSLGGLYTGLKLAATPYVFVTACDMPFLNSFVIQHVVGLKDGVDIVVVRSKTGLHTTHAVYGQRCLPVIEHMLSARQLSIREMVNHSEIRTRFVDAMELQHLDPSGESFINVNTPDDLFHARKRDRRI